MAIVVIAALALFALVMGVCWSNDQRRAIDLTGELDRLRRVNNQLVADRDRWRQQSLNSGGDFLDLSARHDALTSALRSAISAAVDPDVEDPPF